MTAKYIARKFILRTKRVEKLKHKRTNIGRQQIEVKRVQLYFPKTLAVQHKSTSPVYRLLKIGTAINLKSISRAAIKLKNVSREKRERIISLSNARRYALKIKRSRESITYAHMSSEEFAAPRKDWTIIESRNK